MESLFRTFNVQPTGIPVRIVPSEDRWRRVLIGVVVNFVFLSGSATEITTVPDLLDVVRALPGTSLVLLPQQPLYAVVVQGGIAATLGVHISDHVTWANFKQRQPAVPM